MSRFLELKKIVVKDPFWSSRQKLISKVVIPHQEKVLNDRIPGIEKSHAIANFRIAAGMEDGDFYGYVFQDSDLAKWLEGAAYSLIIAPDTELEGRVDRIIDIIEKAQQPDGYLDTYFIVKEPDRKFQNLQECHELYCAGHMMEAAVAYFEATGKDKLLKVMQKTADCIDHYIGAEDGKIHGIPGHEEVEIGLLRMYQVTGNKRDLDLAEYFLNERGKNPSFFKEEKKRRGWSVAENNPENSARSEEYHQIYAPVRMQKEARGHSVRAMYLYTAMAEYADVRKDEEMKHACEGLWHNVAERQMYITGGIGQEARWEGFTYDYDLPNDTAYAETCASIGLIMFSSKMLRLEKDGKYADVMERALYNGVLSGMQLDGSRFFYVNPLEVIPGRSGKMPGYEHIRTQRPAWFPCACCPPNIVRLLTSIGRYAWEEDDNTIYSHFFLGGTADLSLAKVDVTSKFPREGEISYIIDPKTEEPFAIAIHIPEYLEEYHVFVNGTPAEEYSLEKGYLYLRRSWKKGDQIALKARLAVRRIYANPLVRANIGCVALMRGPIVYCIESVDNAENLAGLWLTRGAECRVVAPPQGLPQDLDAIAVRGVRTTAGDALYSTQPPKDMEVTITAIPYFAWGNRGENEMRVWIHEK